MCIVRISFNTWVFVWLSMSNVIVSKKKLKIYFFINKLYISFVLAAKSVGELPQTDAQMLREGVEKYETQKQVRRQKNRRNLFKFECFLSDSWKSIWRCTMAAKPINCQCGRCHNLWHTVGCNSSVLLLLLFIV